MLAWKPGGTMKLTQLVKCLGVVALKSLDYIKIMEVLPMF